MPAPQIHNVGEAPGPEQWFHSLPLVTKYWFGATVVLTLAGNFQIVSPYQFVFAWNRVYENFEVWRLLSCFCYAGPFHINTLFAVYMLVQFSKQYEAGGPFNTGAGGGTADYIFMLMIGVSLILLSYPFIGSFLSLAPIFTRTLVFFVLYTWSKRHPTANANIWGVPVGANYLPFAYLALSVLMGGAWADILHGMVVGHIYYFLVDVVPQVYGRDIIQTPQFLVDKIGIGEYRPDPVVRVAPPAGMRPGAAPREAGGYNWGRGGQALGRE